MRLIASGVLVLVACTTPTSSSIADSVTGLVTAGDRLFWTNEGNQLFTSTLSGDDVQRVAPAQPAGECSVAGQLQATATAVYWPDCNLDLWRVNSDGTEAGPVGVTIPMGVSFAVDDADVYSGLSALVEQPLDGRPAISLTTVPHVIMSAYTLGDHIYFGGGTPIFGNTHDGGVWSVALDGSDETEVIVDENGASTLAVDPAGLFWSSQIGTFRANLDGTGTTMIDERVRYLVGSSLQIADGRVFWATVDNEVVSVALDGTDRQVHYTGTSWVVGPVIANHTLYLFESDAKLVSQNEADGATTYHLVSVAY